MASVKVKLNMTKAALVDSRSPDANNSLLKGANVWLHRDKENGEQSYLFIGFSSFSNSLKRKKLLNISTIGIRLISSNSLFAQGLKANFNANTLTWNNMPGGVSDRLYAGYRNITAQSSGWIEHPDSLTTIEKSEHAKAILKYSGMRLYASQAKSEKNVVLYGYSGYPDYDSEITPFIEVEYDDGANLTSQITPLNNKSGYLNPAKAQTFTWDFLSADANYVCAGDFAQSSAKLFWKVHSDSSYNQIAASGSTKSVTVPANTFPANSQIDWYISGTDEDGTTTTSSVYTISTSDTTAIATAISPMNTVEDGNGPITFRWSLSNAYGNDPSLVNLWWKLPSEGNQNWHVIVSSSTPITEYTTPAGYFPAGEIQWLVHAYNQDNVRGPDSQGSFICVAAPEAPDGISSDGVPYATITWQCDGQQAYRIAIDGVDYGVHFGTEKSFTLEEPLEDGEHTVTISAQGVYGLWSQEGTGIIQITNTPGSELVLIARGTCDAELEWATLDADLDIYIYRDGMKIGHADAYMFIDRLALGSHSYYVINKYANGNYSKSNIESITLETDRTLIASYPPKMWLDIRLTENSSSKQSFSYQRTISTRHFLGAAYPVVEMSPFEDSTGSYDTAALDAAAAAEFEKMKGKVVCIKSRMGVVLVGIMSTMQKNVSDFFASYTFSVKRIHWEDYVDDTIS